MLCAWVLKQFPCDYLYVLIVSCYSPGQPLLLIGFTSNCLLGHDTIKLATSTGFRAPCQSLVAGRSLTVMQSVTAYMYLERVELYLTANEIAGDKKVAVFLSSMESTTYTLLRDLVVPAKPADKTLEELFKHLNDHYNLTPGYSRMLQFSQSRTETYWISVRIHSWTEKASYPLWV